MTIFSESIDGLCSPHMLLLLFYSQYTGSRLTGLEAKSPTSAISQHPPLLRCAANSYRTPVASSHDCSHREITGVSFRQVLPPEMRSRSNVHSTFFPSVRDRDSAATPLLF